MVVFERPIGAPADVKELEYVSCLHQTGATIRVDGSIHAKDVQLFLKSRYGINATLSQITETIFRNGMGGNNLKTEGEVIDLMEMTAILLIPYLCKAAAVEQGQTLPDDGVLAPSKSVLGQVCQMILEDVFLSEGKSPWGDRVVHRPPLTTALIQKILRAYGEDDLANDTDLVQAMLDQIRQPPQPSSHGQPRRQYDALDVDALAAALTADTAAVYQIASESRMSTPFQDVFFSKYALEHDNNDEEEFYHHHLHQYHHQNNNNNNKKKKHDEISSFFFDRTTNSLPDEAEQHRQQNTPPPHTKDQNKKNHDNEVKTMEIKKCFTAPSIDLTAGTYRSKALIVVLWAGVLFSYITFILSADVGFYSRELCKPLVQGNSWNANIGPIYCHMFANTLWWLVNFIVLFFYGILVVGWGSVGNNNYVSNNKAWKPMVAILFLLAMATTPFRLDYVTEGTMEDEFRSIRAVTTVFLVVAIVLQSVRLVYMVMPQAWGLKAQLRKRFYKAENAMKAATHFKINRMVENALEIHQKKEKGEVLKTNFSRALQAFSEHKHTEKIGGRLWAWRCMLNGKILREEGVWFSARLVAGNISQFVVSFLIFVFGIKYIFNVLEDFDEEDVHAFASNFLQTEVDPEVAVTVADSVSTFVSDWMVTLEDFVNCTNLVVRAEDIFSTTFNQTEALCALMNNPAKDPRVQEAVLQATGFATAQLQTMVNNALQDSLDSSIESLYPKEKYMVAVPLILGLVTATLTSLSLALSYLPSITTTTLKLRSGVIPTLTDPRIGLYRIIPTTICVLTGSLFWGCLLAGLINGALIGSILFFFLYQGTTQFAQQFFTLIIGAVLILLLQVLIRRLGAVLCFEGYYRKAPAHANIIFIGLEWANFALSASFALVRFLRLLLVTAPSVGRIDRPFLAEGVGQLGRIEMDPIPTVQMRGILLQEAHRHPYIEALGSMYLLKLRYGPRFCTSAGSCWRLVFVHALMPWLKKHRLIEMFDQDYMCVDAEEADSGDLRRSKSLRIDPNLLGARRRNNFVAANSKLKEENEQLKVSMMALQRQLSMMSMNLPRVVRHDISESTENTALTQESGLSRTSSKSRKSTKESRDGKHVKAKKPKQSRTKSADDAYAVSDSDRAQIQEFLSESGNPLPRAEPTQVKKTKRGTKVPKAKKTKKPIRDYPSKDGGAS